MGIRVPISIRGLIIAAAWTQKGEVAAVDIAGYDEKRYRVVDDRIGKQLRTYIKKKVVVHGVLDTENGNKVLYVERFRIDNPDEPSSSVSGKTEKPL